MRAPGQAAAARVVEELVEIGTLQRITAGDDHFVQIGSAVATLCSRYNGKTQRDSQGKGTESRKPERHVNQLHCAQTHNERWSRDGKGKRANGTHTTHGTPRRPPHRNQ